MGTGNSLKKPKGPKRKPVAQAPNLRALAHAQEEKGVLFTDDNNAGGRIDLGLDGAIRLTFVTVFDWTERRRISALGPLEPAELGSDAIQRYRTSRGQRSEQGMKQKSGECRGRRNVRAPTCRQVGVSNKV